MKKLMLVLGTAIVMLAVGTAFASGSGDKPELLIPEHPPKLQQSFYKTTVSLKQYERLLRDTCIMGKQGLRRGTREVGSFLVIDRGVSSSVFIVLPESGKAELHVVNIMNEKGTEYKIGIMVDEDLDGTPDYYQTTHYNDGIGKITSEGTDTSNLLDLWYYWLKEFIRLTGGGL